MHGMRALHVTRVLTEMIRKQKSRVYKLLALSLALPASVANADIGVDGVNVGANYVTAGDVTGTNAASFLVNITAANGGATSFVVSAGDTIKENDSTTFYVAPGATLGTLDNRGTILGNVFNAINVNATGSITTLTNSGLIQGRVNGNAALALSGVIGTFANSGTLSNTGTSSTLIVNKATRIDNTGTMEANSGRAVLIGFSGVAAIGAFENNGTIVTNGAGVEAVRLGDGADADVVASFVNNGTIRNTGGGAAIGVNSNTVITNGITNTGLIDGSVSLHTAALNLDGAVGRITGAVTGAAASRVNVNGNFTSESAFSVGTLNIASGGRFNLSRQTVTATTLTNAGTLTVDAGTTSTIAGNYVQDAGGVYRTSVASDTDYGRLVVSGSATLPVNARIDVNVSNPDFRFSAARLEDIISAGTLASDGTFAITDNSTLFDFSAVKDESTVDLKLTAVRSGVLDAVKATGNVPAIAVATVLDAAIASAPTGPLAGLFVGLTGERAVSDAVSQTLPLLAGGTTTAATAALDGVNRIITSRNEANRGSSPGDDLMGNKNVWLKPFGSWTRQTDRAGVSGFKADSYGLIVGADGTPSTALRMGAAFAYSRSDIDGRSAVAPQSADLDIYQLIGYGSYSLDDRTHVDFQGNVGQNTTNGRRNIPFARSVASSRYDSLVTHVGAGIGRSYPLGGQTSLTPSLRVDYTRIKDKAYRETGAGALNLDVQSRSIEAFVVGIDAQWAHRFGVQSTVIADLGIGYDTLNKQPAMTASFAGAPGAVFTSYGIKPSPWLLRAGVGLAHQITRGFEITGRYDVEYRKRFVNQTASVKATWNF